MKMQRRIFDRVRGGDLAIGAAWLFIVVAASGDELKLVQLRNADAPKPIPPAELAKLGDPFFNRMLKNHAEVTKLKDVLELIEPDPGKRRVYVVDEEIVDTTATGGRRAVVDFTAAELQGNVMLAPSLTPTRFPGTSQMLEVWGWDDQRGRYNYYRMDSIASDGNGNLTSGPLTWKFRGSSEDVDLLLPNAEKPELDGTESATRLRDGRCFECHINGGPVMKELLRPWNNWHSLDFKAKYLDPHSPGAWPVATLLPAFGKLAQAETLEDPIIQGLRRFNTKRLAALLQRQPGTDDPQTDAGGRTLVLDGPRLLRPLFVATELNLISAVDRTGLQRFNAATDFVPELKFNLPNSAFLNVSLIAGGQAPNYAGLKIIEASSFSSFSNLTQEENLKLVKAGGLGLLGRNPGDTHFGWFGPEASHIDNDLVDQCLKRGVITSHFLAAVLAIDLENPVFSARRAGLLKLIPKTFSFTPVTGGEPAALPRDASNDLLTKAVIEKLEFGTPAAGSAEAEFLNLLKSTDAVPLLKQRVIAYRDRVQAALASTPATRNTELNRLFQRLLRSRDAMLKSPVFSPLDETGHLFPTQFSP